VDCRLERLRQLDQFFHRSTDGCTRQLDGLTVWLALGENLTDQLTNVGKVK